MVLDIRDHLHDPDSIGVPALKIKEFRKIVRTYKDWELQELLRIYAWDGQINKTNIAGNELARREVEREDGTYYDETLPPTVSIAKRLLTIRKNISK